MTFQSNPGYCPPEAKDKRVRVILANGHRCGFEPVANAVPAGWAADGRQACRWTLTDDPWDIAEYEVISG